MINMGVPYVQSCQIFKSNGWGKNNIKSKRKWQIICGGICWYSQYTITLKNEVRDQKLEIHLQSIGRNYLLKYTIKKCTKREEKQTLWSSYNKKRKVLF